jgi:hypothetical protein
MTTTQDQGVNMHTLPRFLMTLLVLVFLAGCAIEGGGRPRSKAEQWAGVTTEEFVDKDTHMREFYKDKIVEQERIIRDNNEELEKLKRANPTDPMDMMHDALKKDRLEREIAEAKKSKKNWEGLQREHIQKQQGNSGGGGSSGGCSH